MTLQVCRCGHRPHGPRASRGKPHREVVSGCLAEGCPCENYVPAAENSDILTPEQKAKMIRDFERDLRQMQIRLQQLKQTV